MRLMLISSPPQTTDGTAYYLDHFRQVLEAVRQRYGFLLDPAEHAHISRIETLRPPAQMLYARLVNRKGPCFRPGSEGGPPRMVADMGGRRRVARGAAFPESCAASAGA